MDQADFNDQAPGPSVSSSSMDFTVGNASLASAPRNGSTLFHAYSDDSDAFESRYALEEALGRGSFAVVHAARDRQTGARVAVKVVPRDAAGYNADEAAIAMALSHPSIVTTMAVYELPDRTAIVSELVGGGELHAHVDRGGRLPESLVRRRMGELLDAIDHMHARGYAHRDVKLENLLIADDDSLRLIDFGYSKECLGGRTFRSCCGSPNYMAPEILLASRARRSDAEGSAASASGGAPVVLTRHSTYGREVDLWACGVVMYALLFGAYPFHHERHSAFHRRILRAEYDIPADAVVSAEALDLLRALLTVDPARRATAYEARRHAWFTGGHSFSASPSSGPAAQGSKSAAMADAAAAASSTPAASDIVFAAADAESTTPRKQGQSHGHASAAALLFTPPTNRHVLDASFASSPAAAGGVSPSVQPLRAAQRRPSM